MKGRVWFPKNPWPDGHAITKAVWSGRLVPETSELRFDLHVETAAYNAEDEDTDDGDDAEDDDDLGDWGSPSVWANYHRCSLSSTKWQHHGFVVGTAKKPFAWSKLDGHTYRVDRAPDGELPDDDDTAFGIYLTGHDGVADNAIKFTRRGASWAIDWKAKIALAYIGHTELEHKMKLELSGLTFDGFSIPKGLAPKKAKAMCDSLVADPAKWQLAGRRYVRAR